MDLLKLVHKRLNTPLAVALAALVTLLAVQLRLEQQVWSLMVAVGLALGLSAWTWCVWQQPPRPDQPIQLQAVPLGFLPWRIGLTTMATAAALAAWFSFEATQWSARSGWAWVLAVLLWLLAWWPWQHQAAPPLPSTERRKRLLAALAVLSITLLGAWLRFQRLDTMPYDMTQDHSWKLLDVYSVLEGERPLFFPNNTGREPGQFYYIAALIRLFDLPLDFMALKIGNALIGTLTIPLIYVFAREIGGRKLGVLAAFLYTVGKWPLATTRMGLRFPYATLPAALILFHLWRYVRLGKRTDAVLTGFWMGFGLYGYIGIRVVPLVIGLVFLGIIYQRLNQAQVPLQTVCGHMALVLITSWLVFLPLGHFMVEYPDVFWYRAATRSSSAEQPIDQFCVDTMFADPSSSSDRFLCRGLIFAHNTMRAFTAFNWRGDRSEVNHVRFDPFFDLVTATCLLAALPILVWRLFKERSLRWWLLVAATPLLLLTTTLSLAFPEENPSTSRTGVVMPLMFLFAAAPLALLSEWLLLAQPFQRWRTLPRWRLATLGTLLLLLGGLAAQQNYVRYFRDLAAQYRWFVPNSGEIAAEIESFAPRGITAQQTYLLTWPYWLELRTLSIHLGNIFWHEAHKVEPDEALPFPQKNQPILYVLNVNDQRRRDELLTRFPTGELTVVETELAHQRFITFFVPANSPVQR